MKTLERLADQMGFVRASAPEPLVDTPSRAAAASGVAPSPPGMDFVAIGVETACGRPSSICQIGIVGFAGGHEVLAWTSLVDPQDEFAAFNTCLHGIGPSHVQGQPRFSQLYGALLAHFGARIIVSHSCFDQVALAAACRVAGLPMVRNRWLDSVRVARHAWPELPSHRLNLVAEHLGLEHRHHDALSDARVAGWVVAKASERVGLDMEGWMAAPWRRTPRRASRSVAPTPADAGALVGRRVALLGELRDGPLAQMIAAAGGRVVTTVGARTDLLAIADNRPFDKALSRCALYRRAEAMIAQGQDLRIVSERELSALIADGNAAT